MVKIRVSGYLDEGINSRDERLPSSTQQHRNGRRRLKTNTSILKLGGGVNETNYTSGRRRVDGKDQSRHYMDITSSGDQQGQQSRRTVDRMHRQDTDEEQAAGPTTSPTYHEIPEREIMDSSASFKPMILLSNLQHEEPEINNGLQSEIEDEEDCTCCDIYSNTRREPFCNEGTKNLCTLGIWAVLTIVIIHRFLVHMSMFLHSHGSSESADIKNFN